MRIGRNPARYHKSDYRPARVTVCVLVFIPERSGYFEHRFDVLKLCLDSIIKHTPHGTYDLMVFDNGSCSEIVRYLSSLHDQRLMQYLILSPCNIGVANAHRIMFHAAPGELIAYSDDDVLFHPGWLQAHLEILDIFPRAAMVSGMPVRQQFRYGNRYLQTYLSEFPEVLIKSGRLIPEEWEMEFSLSIGRNVDKVRTFSYIDVLLEYQGIKAYSTATHFQFVTPKSIILQGIDPNWEKKLMGGQRELDERIDSMGYARLSTFQRYVQHMGNVVTPQLREAASGGIRGER
jgi:glycosyltransferase involved in cell wall biosynthesis